MSRLLYQTELPRPSSARLSTLNARSGGKNQGPLTESNRRPSPYHGDALPTELRGLTAAPDQ